jgi:hypothetical protein
MSLINDALKRATQAPSVATPAPQPEAPMQPVPQRRPAGLPAYFAPVLLFIISGACWFLVKGWDARRQAGLYPAPITVQARESATPSASVEATGAIENRNEFPIPANRQFALNDTPSPSASAPAAADSPEPVAPAATASSAAPPIPEPTAAPTFKLQGIFYRPSHPSAVVNTKTVYIGDLILGGKVRAIDRQSVTIDIGGTTQVLTLQ